MWWLGMLVTTIWVLSLIVMILSYIGIRLTQSNEQ